MGTPHYSIDFLTFFSRDFFPDLLSIDENYTQRWSFVKGWYDKSFEFSIAGLKLKKGSFMKILDL